MERSYVTSKINIHSTFFLINYLFLETIVLKCF
nr:MAG TPA: hypothetical protein [Caudoviricetes sp.]